jgi:hypothetical protein
MDAYSPAVGSLTYALACDVDIYPRVTIGYVVQHTDRFITLAATLDPKHGDFSSMHYDDINCIPLGMIVRYIKLGKG